MIIAFLAAAASAAELPASRPQPIADPAACGAAERARRDQAATINARFADPQPDFGPLGRQYRELSERLAAAMKADQPDMEKIGALWREADRVKVEIGSRWLTTQTQCTLDRLKLLPPGERKEFLRGMAPMTKEERRKVLTVPPPPPPTALPPRNR